MTLQSKTSCFTMSDSSDRCVISITLPNNLSYNKIQRKVIDRKAHKIWHIDIFFVLLPANCKTKH